MIGTTLPRDLAQHELLGLRARVLDSPDPSQRGMEGAVWDETRNTLVIKTAGGVKRVAKPGCTLEFRAPGAPGGDGGVRVRGDVLVGRPEDRVKRNAPRGRGGRRGPAGGRRSGAGPGDGAGAVDGGAAGTAAQGRGSPSNR